MGYDTASEAAKKEFDDNQGKAPNAMLAALIIFSFLTLVFACMIYCKYSDVKLAIDVIDASADYVAHNKRVVLVPVLHFFITLTVIILWLGCFLCVISLNEIKVDPVVPQAKDLVWTKQVRYMALFMLFGLLWVTAWLEYTSRFIAIVGATTYYFDNSRERTDEEAPADICFGFKCAYLHHMGSLAFGAFIIALIRFIKILFYYAAKKAEQAGGENAAVKAAVGCAKCCLDCIEKICDYVNTAAFCYMAITGDPFLSAAWSGFLLNLKHGFKFFFAQLLARVFIFLGKCGIVAGNCFSLYMLMKVVFKDFEGDEAVKNIAAPIILVGAVTYVAASLFLSLFSVAVQALLTCLCCDLDMNNGEAKFGPATFHDDKMSKVKSAKGKKKKKAEE